jgi:hypothetical protein
MPTTDTNQPIPVVEDPTAKYAANTWLSGGIGSTEDLQVPSGQLCLVRRPGVQGLIQAGVLRNIDSLSALVSEKHLKRGKKPQDRKSKKGDKDDGEIDIKSIMKDTKTLENIMHTVDRVVCHCVVKPEVHMTPNDATSRKTGIVYADMIDITDKMFIFNFVVGGTRDMESFRGELEGLVGSVDSVEGVQTKAE